MNRKKIHFNCWIWIGIFSLLGGQLHAQTASDIMAQAAKAYNQSNGLDAGFAVRVHSPAQGIAESFEGQIRMKGEKFQLKTPDMQIWFDGKTQWIYIDQTEEVNVNNPSGEELQTTNPILLLNSWQKGFDASKKGESTSPNGKAAYDILLTPKKKGDIKEVELQIEKNSHLPARLRVETRQGVSTTITISQVKTGVNQPDSFFVFKEADFPDVEIIDLR